MLDPPFKIFQFQHQISNQRPQKLFIPKMVKFDIKFYEKSFFF